ncbi:MAG: pilus assembly protein TadG-related protein, partial [Pseudomonadota bacterium]
MNSGSLAALTQHRFTRDDKGGITMFVVVLFVVMAVVAGGAIDLARHETARADLQNALDRGVLAAANWNSDVPDNAAAQSVVQGYMASRQQRGTPYQLQVNNTPAATGRAISASASLDIDTIFLTAMGLDQLDVPASAGAAQTVGLTEVVLVLDVSGSMGWDSSWNDGQSKLDDLKFAAKQFIDTVLAGSSADRTLISIVPYSAQVTLPASMAAQYNLNTHHNYSYCVDYDDLDYATLGISLDASLEQHE